MKKYIYITLTLIVIIILYLLFFNTSNGVNNSLTTKVIKGNLPIEIITTGELVAINSQNILAPSLLRSLDIRQIKINTLVDEGTILKKGDFVASLDPSEIGVKLNQIQLEFEQKLSDLKSTKIDTSLSMKQERENIINLKYALEESETEVKQSVYEPPAVQRKAEISLEKSKRNYLRALENIKLIQEQATAKIFKVNTELKQLQIKIDQLNEGLNNLEVLAPHDGMLIYYENWDGKVKEGSTINSWNPIIASIPNLSKMISKTYVNEIDISRVKKGQKVDMNIDAFPGKKIEGEVITIANMGQQIDGSDAKVFQVEIEILTNDSILRPAMTTSNKIKIKELKNVFYLPIECVFINKDTQFVYLKKGNSIFKKEVKIGESNNEFIEIINGVIEDDEVLLIAPENELEIKFIKLND